MYQGKFEAKNRSARTPVPEEPQSEPQQRVYKPHQSASEAARQQIPQARPQQPRQNPYGQQGQQNPYGQRQNPYGQQPRQNPGSTQGRPQGSRPQQPPYPNMQRPTAPAKPQKRGPRLGGIIFYTLYFMLIAVFAVGMLLGLNWLDNWLVEYEAAQPTVKCQEVFDQLFSNPDWGNLYDLAGIQDTAYEGKDAFVAYMTEKVGSTPLTYVETSAGLSGDKKYFVKLGDERIASFTLEGKQDKVTDIPDWQFGKVELFFDRADGYLIQIVDGHTAFVNGVALDDSFVIQITSSSAADYLPVGTTGAKTDVLSVTGLMMKPTVTVKDQTGADMPVSYDEEKGMFVEQTESNTITEEEQTAVTGALKAYGEFMINASGARASLAKYYDTSADAYKDILKIGSELWMNKDNGHRFTAESVTDYCKYSDELFSARGHVTMNVTLKDGNTRDYELDMALFFRKSNGSWKCYGMTNEDVTKPVGKVRLTFIDGNGITLVDDFFETDASTLTTPVLSAPEGKVFSGWYTEKTVDGHKELTIMFQPDENGKVTIPSGTTLEPMTLRPLFEDASAAASTEAATEAVTEG